MSKKKELQQKIKEIVALSKSAKDAAAIQSFVDALEKARKKLSDEYDPEDQQEPETEEDELRDQGARVFDPDEEESEADKWLQENDPKFKKKPVDEDEEEEPEEEESADPFQSLKDDYQEPEEEEEEPEAEEPVAAKPSAPAAAPAAPGEEDEDAETGGRFPQPTPEEIQHMRQYTRPWEQRARDSTRLRAEAHKNPVLHHEGHILEARNKAHKDFRTAHDEFLKSPEYQNADPISQMEMESNFTDKFHKENPDYLSNAHKIHAEAHNKGKAAAEQGAAARQAQLGHIMSGGAQSGGDTHSVEAGMQHAGGSKDDEGTTGAMVQDSASSFANNNQSALNRLTSHSKKYKSAKEFDDTMRKLRNPKEREALLQANPELEFAEKNQPVLRRIIKGNERNAGGKNFDENMSYGGEDRNIEALLGDHPNLKDPAKKAKVDAFFKQYHPLIQMSASRVLNKLGIDPRKAGDLDLGSLHEAGMHGLMQAINDYDHNNTRKTKFVTHAGNKIRGLMQTAMRDMDSIPAELRSAVKNGKTPQQQGQSAPQSVTPPAPAPVTPPKPTAAQHMASHPKGQEMADRMARANTQRAAHGVILRKPKSEGGQ